MSIKAHITAAASLLDDRQEPRRGLKIETSGISGEGDEANVTIHNLSSAGLLIETDLPLEVGAWLAVDLPDAGPADAEIVWKSERLYGCAFTAALREKTASGAPASQHDHAPRLALTGGEALGQHIHRLRHSRGMTLADVAEALGVSKPTVWAWEKGKARPLPERIEALATVLGVTTDDLSDADEAAHHGADVVAECRARIAQTFSTSPQMVRISIEL